MCDIKHYSNSVTPVTVLSDCVEQLTGFSREIIIVLWLWVIDLLKSWFGSLKISWLLQ